MYILLELYVYYSKIEQILILLKKKKMARVRFYVMFYHVKKFAVELQTVEAVEMKVKKC